MSFEILGIGCGEGGGRLAASMVKHGINIGAINTNKGDLDGLDSIPESKKLLLEISGGGSGKDPLFVKESIKSPDARKRISSFIGRLLETTPIFTNCTNCGAKEKLLDTEAVGMKHKCSHCNETFGIMQIQHEANVKHNYIFLFACLGGGSGSGLINDIIDICYTSFGLPVAVICTIPDDEKDMTEKNNAVSIFRDLYNNYAVKGLISPLILVDNQRMFEMYSHLPIGSTYKSINDYIATFISKFNDFSNKTSKYMSTVDMMDTGRLWSLGGCCTMGKFLVGKSKLKENNGQLTVPHPLAFEEITEAIKQCVVVDGFDLTSAKGVGVIAVAPEYFLQDENVSKCIRYTFAQVKEIIGDGLIFNGQYDDNSSDALEFYLFFNGLKYPEDRFNRLWEDIKSAKVLIQKKKERIDEVPYDTKVESGSSGQNFARLQSVAMGKEQQDTIQREVEVSTSAKKRPCNNCFLAGGVSLGIYKKGGPVPFDGKVCPVCRGKGKI